jgi:DNA-binding Lrp family transcriptional regulator
MAASSRTTARSRRPRTVRCDVQPVVQLAERDRWLLEALAKMRFLPTSDLARLLFGGSRSAANKRLRRLFDAGLVRVWLRSLSEENVYSLTRAGLNAVRSSEPAPADIFNAQVPRGLDGKLDHLLAINRVRIALATTLPEAGGELTWWRSDWDLCGRGSDRIAPDALFCVRWPDGREQAFSLEVDRRTRGVRRFLEKVLRYRSQAYRLAALHGVRGYVILVVGFDRRWIERFRASVAHLQLTAPVWFATLQDLNSAGACGAIWRSAERDARHSLRDLACLPYGKEGTGGETHAQLEG